MEIVQRGSERILVLAPAGRDAVLVCAALREAEVCGMTCHDMHDLCRHLASGAGAVLLTEEALRPEAVSTLAEVLQAQPPWSDLPLILFVDDERRLLARMEATAAFGPRRNLTILERPIHVPTLATIVQLALRARRRQYEVQELLDHLEELNQTLEQRVEARTADLTAANARLRQEVAERQRLEQELMEVSTQERHRFAQDLHDGLCQQLTSLSFMAATLHAQFAHDEKLAQRTERIARLAERAIRETRALSHGLFPLELQNHSLVKALEELSANISEAYRITCLVEHPHPVHLGDLMVGTNLYRIAQEAISNAIRHGRASRVVITLHENEEGLTLTVADDGVGIQERPVPGGGGIGLRTMHSRARLIGGTLDIRPEEAGGTLVVCRVPHHRLNRGTS